MNNLVLRVLTIVFGGGLFLGAYFLCPLLFSLLLLGVGVFILFLEWPKLCAKSPFLWALTPLYPILPILALIYLNHAYRSVDILLPLYPFFISWAVDTGGYIFGKLFGKHKICPRLSPKKSWEGLFGGW